MHTGRPNLNCLQWIHQPHRDYFPYDDFQTRNHGRDFSIRLTKTDDISYWGIQVISDTPVRLKPGFYSLKFEAEASMAGALYVNIQTDNGEDLRQLFSQDQRISVLANERKAVALKFRGDTFGGRLLTFKMGRDLPSGTLLSIRNIAVEELTE